LRNNIPIIRIPYKHRDLLKLEDLQLETTEYLIRNEEEMLDYFNIPRKCPNCGENTIIKFTDDSEVLYCTNPNCSGKLLGRFVHFVSKRGMDIDGLSEKNLEVFINLGIINRFSDIYNLKDHRARLETVPGFGKRSIDKLLSAIEKSRDVDLAHFICALSIPGIGPAQSKVLANKFKKWEAFDKAATNKYDFKEIDGFGRVISDNIHNWFRDNSDQLCSLVSCLRIGGNSTSGDILSTNPTDSSSEMDLRGVSLVGKNFVITGKLNGGNRDMYVNKITALGGKVASSVSKNTSYLINNDINSTSSKNKKAQDLGIPIISEVDFLHMIGEK